MASQLASFGRKDVLAMYRELMRLGKRYPSKNRDGIVREIRLDFKKNVGITREDEKQKEIKRAYTGLLQMRQMVRPAGTVRKVQLGEWDI
mmetsp:Transcript_24513/g.34262  ORF Transcript_24513/g.34262 Transcript_24513/m.34262 type:complete len:90 (+) Transcript_24513:223-492(+)